MTMHAGVPKLLTLDEAAELCRRTPKQMRWLRYNDRGPRSANLGGRVVYREEDVIRWINEAFERGGREQVGA